jgi:hypothetical protein
MKKVFTLLLISQTFFVSIKVSSQTLYEEYKYTGTINGNPIVLTFLVPDHFYNNLQGTYYYTKYNKEIEFKGDESDFAGRVSLTESIDGKETGKFIFIDLNYDESKIVGNWYSPEREKLYDVVLTSSRNLQKEVTYIYSSEDPDDDIVELKIFKNNTFKIYSESQVLGDWSIENGKVTETGSSLILKFDDPNNFFLEIDDKTNAYEVLNKNEVSINKSAQVIFIRGTSCKKR